MANKVRDTLTEAMMDYPYQLDVVMKPIDSFEDGEGMDGEDKKEADPARGSDSVPTTFHAYRRNKEPMIFGIDTGLRIGALEVQVRIGG